MDENLSATPALNVVTQNIPEDLNIKRHIQEQSCQQMDEVIYVSNQLDVISFSFFILVTLHVPDVPCPSSGVTAWLAVGLTDCNIKFMCKYV
jgi:hypothetical protein